MSDDTGCAPVSVKRFDWERRLIEADLPLPTKAVALICATYASSKGQRIFPGEANLARQCHSDVRSVRRHLARLRESGYLTRVQTGSSTGHRNYADLYWLTFPADDAEGDTRTGSPTKTGQNRPVLPDKTVRPSVHSNISDSHRSASLTLAHDKSRADDEQRYEDAVEDTRDRLEAWAVATSRGGIGDEHHRSIDGMSNSRQHPRLIENYVKARVREAESVWPTPHEVERDWAASAECPF